MNDLNRLGGTSWKCVAQRSRRAQANGARARHLAPAPFCDDVLACRCLILQQPPEKLEHWRIGLNRGDQPHITLRYWLAVPLSANGFDDMNIEQAMARNGRHPRSPAAPIPLICATEIAVRESCRIRS
ncbi:hypothetical protein [Bradyrhizobium pachyrhizi]|uniref:hypothetical protein n=1 Tax=Bradyrhizobium pachyrhizi TaxID=280333 RepID=UPI00128F271C|nr:hypothetical protein [Bradyrhizobium pachyrhizi]